MGSQQYTQLLKKLATGMLSLTGALVFLVGAWVLVSAFSSVGPSNLELQSYLTVVVNDSGGKSEEPGAPHPQTQRNPSSLMPADSSLPINIQTNMLRNIQTNIQIQKQGDNETLALGCLRDGVKIEMKSGAKRVRLKASFCDGLAMSLNESSVVNRANGFEATLFNLESGGFTSDYISLAEGRNQLLFQLKNSKGDQAAGEITVSRAEVKIQDEPNNKTTDH